MVASRQLKRFIGFDNEQILLQALKRGDEQAVEYWFQKYRAPLRQVALSRLPSEVVAQEIVQETFINCLQTINLFKGKASLLTWMQSVLRHEIADYYRKAYAKKIIRTTPLADLLLEQGASDSWGTADAVTAVLRQMLARHRELLLRKYVDCQRVKDIAVELGMSDKAVESGLWRARQEFKTLWLAQEI